MAADIFLELGSIKGESKDSEHKDKIEVMSWAFQESQSGSASVGGGMGEGKVAMSDIQISKLMDKASPKLFLACAKGEHIPKATLIMRKAGGGQKKYLEIVLNDVLVSSYSTSGSGGGMTPSESISLNFGKMTIEYFEQDNKGTTTSAGKAGYDIKANKAVA